MNSVHQPECQGTTCYCDEIPCMSYEEGVARADSDRLSRELVAAARASNTRPSERRRPSKRPSARNKTAGDALQRDLQPGTSSQASGARHVPTSTGITQTMPAVQLEQLLAESSQVSS